MHPDLGLPAYYVLDGGRPAVVLGERAFPKALNPDGTWEVLYDLPRFRELAGRVGREEFEALVAGVPNARPPQAS